MFIYDTYGIKTDEIDKAKELLEDIINIQFELRESSYKGGEYYSYDNLNKEHYELHKNYCEEEGWTIEDRQELGLIFKVSCSPKANKIRNIFCEQYPNYIFVIERVLITEDNWYKKYHYIDGKDELILERRTGQWLTEQANKQQ